MRVKTITCSGANENTSIDGLLSLLSEFPMAEAGIQISAEKCSVGTPRYNRCLLFPLYIFSPLYNQ